MVAFGRSGNVGPSLVHPARRFRIPHQVEEPAQQCHTVTTPKAEPPGVGNERVRECAGIVMVAADGIRHHVGDGFGVLVIEEEIRCDPGRTGDEEALGRRPLVSLELAVVEAHIGTTRLLPGRDGELVTIGWQVAKSVEGGRGPMRHDSLSRRPPPGRYVRRKLEPGGSKFEVVRGRCRGQAVHSMRHALEEATVTGQAVKGGSWNARLLRLTARNEPPLIRRDLGKPTDS